MSYRLPNNHELHEAVDLPAAKHHKFLNPIDKLQLAKGVRAMQEAGMAGKELEDLLKLYGLNPASFDHIQNSRPPSPTPVAVPVSTLRKKADDVFKRGEEFEAKTAEKQRQKLEQIQQRLAELRSLTIEFIDHPSFGELRDPPTLAFPFDTHAYLSRKARAGQKEINPTMFRMCSAPLLQPEEERALFFRMNYAKYLAAKIQNSLDPHVPTANKDIDQALQYLQNAREDRDIILLANMRLLVSQAKKFTRPDTSIDDQISVGEAPLMRAIDLFDASRGFKFSTYATWAIRNDLSRSMKKTNMPIVSLDSGIGENLRDTRDTEKPEQLIEFTNRFIDDILRNLDSRQRTIIQMLFGLEEHPRHTLKEIGQRIGLSTERVRQLAHTALRKLRRHSVLPENLREDLGIPENTSNTVA
jgi:RNA polymerase primary sigma factor